MNLAGAKVLITGGGSGIGRHLLDRLIESGAHVATLERDDESCRKLLADYPANTSLEPPMPPVIALACDVSDPTAVDAAVSALEASGFIPGVLINNAGIIHSEPLVNMLSRTDRTHSRDNWRRVMSIDLDSVFYVTSRVVDRMLAKRIKGVVLSISSISARGNAGQSAYAAAKAGVNALTMTWAKELGPMGFRFVAIAPGFIDTPSTRAALSENTISLLTQQIALRRLGALDDVFSAVRYAIENDYINGTVLDVNGGLTF